MLPAPRRRRGHVTSQVGAVALRTPQRVPRAAVSLSGHEQAEPGVLRAARRAGLPGPLQGTGRLPGRAHRRDQGEPGPVAARKRGPPATSGFCLVLEFIQVPTGHSALGPPCEWASDPALVKRRQPPLPGTLLAVFRAPVPFSKMTWRR